MRYLITLLLVLVFAPVSVRADDAASVRPLEFELTIVHLKSAEAIPADQRSLSGAAILDAIPAWRRSGKVEHLTTLRMSALEGQPAMVQIGETVGVVVGRVFTGRPGGGPTQSQYQFEQYGTMVTCTGHIVDADAIEVEVSAEQTRPGRGAAAATTPRSADSGAGAAGGSALGAAGGAASGSAGGADVDTPPAGRSITHAKTLIRARSGECQVIGAAWSDVGEGTNAKLILLVPRVLNTPKTK